jgi:hypothetical protein
MPQLLKFGGSFGELMDQPQYLLYSDTSQYVRSPSPDNGSPDTSQMTGQCAGFPCRNSLYARSRCTWLAMTRSRVYKWALS